MDWWTKVTGFLGVVGFLEAGILLLLDKSMATALIALDFGLFVVAMLVWAPVCWKGCAARKGRMYVLSTYQSKGYRFRVERDRTKFADGQWRVIGYVLLPHGEAEAQVVVSRFGKVNEAKSKLPKV